MAEWAKLTGAGTARGTDRFAVIRMVRLGLAACLGALVGAAIVPDLGQVVSTYPLGAAGMALICAGLLLR